MRVFGRYGRWLLFLLLVAGLLAVALWPRAQAVDVGRVTRGPLMVTIDEEGRTRVRQRFVVSTPVAGRVQRIDLEPGDRVARGKTLVARVLPEAPGLLDARTRSELEAAAAGARTALGRARADEQRARTALEYARTELARTRDLVQSGVGTRQQLEAREAEAKSAEEQVQAAAFATATAQAEVDRAAARLRPAAASSPADASRAVSIFSPVDGVVLKRLRESESVVPPGDPLVEIGDPRNLEVVSDLLSTDAVRVPPEARVLVVDWGGSDAIEARVRRVEPSGFTKISALGVEEQRVNVMMDFVNPTEIGSRLGDGYRVSVRVVLSESADVLRVPTSALFRQGEQWAVYVVEGGRVRLALVEIGRRTAQEAEALRGVSDGAAVVLHPADTLHDGARVQPRAGS
jgi:HlyD family secretion protein